MLLQFLCLLSVSSLGASINLPVVDLGYEHHQARAFNVSREWLDPCQSCQPPRLFSLLGSITTLQTSGMVRHRLGNGALPHQYLQ